MPWEGAVLFIASWKAGRSSRYVTRRVCIWLDETVPAVGVEVGVRKSILQGAEERLYGASAYVGPMS